MRALSHQSAGPGHAQATARGRTRARAVRAAPGPPKSAGAAVAGRGRRVAASTSSSASAAPTSASTSAAKAALYDALASLSGARVSLDRATRGRLEEAITGLEATSPPAHDWRALLPGRWRLVFTTAADVAPFLALSDAIPGVLKPLLPAAGAVFQEFDPPDGDPEEEGPVEGEVRNVIRAGAPPFLRRDDGLTATVAARYEARSGKRLRLRFESAGVGGARLSGLGEALLAPAALPGRGSLQHRAVLAVADAAFSIPLRPASLVRALQPVADAVEREAGSEYLITFLDGDMLIGRQTGAGGGLFAFVREE
jgi:hypothetical protein